MFSRKKNKKKTLKDYLLFTLIFVIAFGAASALIMPRGMSFAAYYVDLWKVSDGQDPATDTIYRESGEVVIGDTTTSGTLLLDVEGPVGATEYCDQDGGNCTAATALGSSDNIHDADNDTIVHTETNANEDIIRFSTGGTERWIMTESRIEPKNTGNSTFIGYNAGLNDDASANLNTYIGDYAGESSTAAQRNTYIGVQAGRNALSSQNTFIGNSAGMNSQNLENTFVGYNSGRNSSFGSNNSFFGASAGSGHTTGHNNTFVGSNAGLSSTTGGNNTLIGQLAGQNVGVGSGNVFIGRQAGANAANVNNNLYIENSNSATPLIMGDFATDEVGINTGTLVTTLTVNGGIATGVRSISADTTAATTDHQLFCDATTAQVNIDLPAAATVKGMRLFVKKTDVTSNKCRFYSSGLETIDGYSEAFENVQYANCTIVSDGNTWYVVGGCQLL